jgi:hypothetical protein
MLLTPRSTIELTGSEPISMLSPPGYAGHAHFWERALSRRDFVRTAAGASALAVAASMAWPAAAFAESESESESGHNASPRPIPGGTDLEGLLGLPPGPLYHFFFPKFGEEASTVTDFNGSMAAAEIQGSGLDNKGTVLTYDADMRFMTGEYIAVDGRRRKGTFAFV